MENDVTKAQKEWMKLGYGMFIHFGANTFEGSGWGSGEFPASEFNPKKLNIAQWADVAAEAGMKYAVLTTKHHDGFCLWQSEYTEYSVKNSPIKKDIIGDFVEQFAKVGIKAGLYYSLWDKNYSEYENDEKYAMYMQAQITELLKNYGDIIELWFDGAWDKDHPSREWIYGSKWESDINSGVTNGERWRWSELYSLIHKLQPNCMVINNSSSNRPGKIKYHPVDLRTAEHYNFVWDEEICEPDLNSTYVDHRGQKKYLPLEFTTSVTPNWFWSKSSRGFCHPSAETIYAWYQSARNEGANLLLNVGPNMDGLIPEYNRKYLKKASKYIAK